MEFFYIYCLFALTTSLTSLYELVAPTLSKAREVKPTLENNILYYFAFLSLNTLFAPLVFFICIIPEWGIRFRETLLGALTDEH